MVWTMKKDIERNLAKLVGGEVRANELVIGEDNEHWKSLLVDKDINMVGYANHPYSISGEGELYFDATGPIVHHLNTTGTGEYAANSLTIEVNNNGSNYSLGYLLGAGTSISSNVEYIDLFGKNNSSILKVDKELAGTSIYTEGAQ